MDKRTITVEKKQCIGVKFRCVYSSSYYNGAYRKRMSFTILKRKSCKGCKSCNWVEEALEDGFVSIPRNPIHNGLYEIDKELMEFVLIGEEE